MIYARLISLLRSLKALLPIFFLSACSGEFSYKRGADFNDLKQQQSSCRNEGESEATVAKCLKENGWIVVGLESHDQLKDRSLERKKTLDPVTISYEKSANNLVTNREELTDQKSSENTTYNVEEDPYQLIKINSWWQAGAGPEQLKRDGDNCLNKLPEGHSANGNFSQVTLGLAYCMQEYGWKVLLSD